MQNAGLDEAQTGIKIAGTNIDNLRYAMIPPYVRKQRGTKQPLEEGEREVWQSWLKIQHSKTKIIAGVQPRLIQGIQRRDGIGEGQETTA